MSDTEAAQTPNDVPVAEPPAVAQPPALWPLLVILAVQFAVMIIPGRLSPGTTTHFNGMVFGSLGGVLAVLIWWMTRRRVRLRERFLGLVFYLAATFLAIAFCLDPSMLGMPVVLYILPSLCLVLAPLLALAHQTGWRLGRYAMIAGVLTLLAGWGALRSKGVDGNISVEFAPRWSPTAEEEFLALANGVGPMESTAETLEATQRDWTDFRGPLRDGRLTGFTFEADWDTSPPKELWRRKVGPGWGSFCIVGDHLFTQEQRGNQEVVACYDSVTGEPRWTNEVTARFEETIGGAGPRATPTFYAGRLYTHGGSGVVQCLEAHSGESVWRRDVTEDTTSRLLLNSNWWGFASSPLVMETDDGPTLVIVYAGTSRHDTNDALAVSDSVIAYDASSGELVWKSGVGTHGYASPHLATLAGVEQVLVSSNAGLESLDPATGKRLWLYEWSSTDFPRIVQPAVLPGDRVVLGTGYGFGSHLFSVGRDGESWTTTTEWESNRLKPYFNDMVYFEGHVYGFDGKFLTCLDAATGEVTWPRSVRRDAAFGHGQALLVEEMGLLVIVTESTGELVLVEANPETLVVRGRFQALDGKTWNHPVIHDSRLYVRNGAEMACFLLNGQRGGTDSEANATE